MSARARWTAEYREARKLERFIDTFHHKLLSVPARERTFPSLRGFDFTRLHGDQLRWVGDGLFLRDVRCHRSLLPCLRNVQPRLPA